MSVATGSGTRFFLPDATLRGVLRGCYSRDVAGSGSSPDQRVTRVPPNPYMGLVWLIDGAALLVEHEGRAVERPLPRAFFVGPTRTGYVSLAAPTCRSFGAILQPAVLAGWVGFDARAAVERIVDARELLPADWHPWLDAVGGAPDHAARVELVEAQCRQRAQQGRAHSPWVDLAIRAWDRAARAAAAGLLGATDRHFQRQARRSAGLRPAEVQRMLRLERAVREARDSDETWGRIAARHGFCDQSHLNRDVRDLLATTPGDLRSRAARGDEGDWMLRL